MKSRAMRSVSAAAFIAMVAGHVLAQPGLEARQNQPGQRAGQQQRQPSQRQMPQRTESGGERAIRPGEHHRAIGWMEGTWSANASRWDRPGGRPMEFEGSLRTEWVLDGRFLRFEFTGSDNEPARAFRGLSYIGYNTVKDEYEGTWMDTTSTQLSHSEGHYHEPSGVLTLHGTFADPSTGEEVKTRVVAHRESEGRWTWEMFNKPRGAEEYKSLEIVFTRAPGQGGRNNPGIGPSRLGEPQQRPGVGTGRPGDPAQPR